MNKQYEHALLFLNKLGWNNDILRKRKDLMGIIAALLVEYDNNF